MPPAEPPTEITIRVKVPPGHIPGAQHDEFSLGILSTSLTIEALRQRIQTLIPTNPAPTQQRILYGGRALADESQSIADALNTRRDPSQNEYVVHLLIRDGARARQPRVDGNNVIPQQQPGHGHVHVGNGHDSPFNARQAMATLTPGANPLMNQATLQQLQDQADQVIQMVHERGQAGLQNMQQNGSANTEQNTSNSHSHMSQATPTPTIPTQTNGAQQVPRPHHHHHHHHHRQPHFHPDPNAWPVPQAIPRPISGQGVHVSGTGPNGQHFTYHHQTFAVPNHLPHPHAGGLPMPFPPMPGFPPMQQQHLQRSASQNDATRQQQNAENQPGRPATSDPNIQATNPTQPNQFVMPTMEDMLAAHRARSQFHSPGLPRLPVPHYAAYNPFAVPAHPADAFRHFPGMPMVQPHVATDHVSVYLLSSPQGPQALVFDSQHGPYAGALHPLQPQFPTAPSTQANIPTPVQPPDAAAQPPNQPGQAVPAAQPDNFAILQPLLGHLWLLIRVMIFAYVLIGSNMGWRRPAALALIAIGFWLLRLGLFGNGGVIRRWWDGIVRVEDVRERLQRLGLPVEGQANAANPAQPAGDTARRFPTPEELAQRLVQEQRDRSALHRFREQIRPVERAFALFVASLWPGVGERYVRALDEAREVEEAARRLLQAQREAAAQEAAQREADAKNEEEKQSEVKEGDSAGASAEVATNVGESASKAAPSAQEQVYES